MLWFADERTPAGQPIADASEFTFYSALTNIDFELNEGNPAAVAIRFNVAQHSFISHANFHLGSARAAIEAVGNQASDIHVDGGQFGIITGKTSPAWQFLLMDSNFSHQRIAAIRTHDAGLRSSAIVLPTFLLRSRFPKAKSNNSTAAICSCSALPVPPFNSAIFRICARRFNLEDIGCAHVPRFVEGAKALQGGESSWPSAPFYVEERFSVGLDIGPNGREKETTLHHSEHAMSRELTPVVSDIPSLPPTNSWTNVRTLGVKGDGGTDDTAALQHAIDTHPALFFPSGLYRLTGSLRLRFDTTLIGFSPFTTQFVLADADPNFQGSGPAVPLLIAPSGGSTIVTGFGIATGNANPRAAGVEWLAGSRSLLEDRRIHPRPQHVREAVAPAMTPPPSPANRVPMQLDAQNASLWVHDGGGGIFRGIWSHAGTARAGLLVENTNTPGVIYQFSCEHHMTKEVRMDHAAGWKVYHLQTEEENRRRLRRCLCSSVVARSCLFVNTYMHRCLAQRAA